jgi:predicted amidohydrolase
MRVACVQLRARDVSESEQALAEAVSAAERGAAKADLVVLPEATYPGYVLHDAGPHLDESMYAKGREAFAQVARNTEKWIAVGLARPEGGRLYNSAVLLAPDGSVAGRTDKTFLWHFDGLWFDPGNVGEVARTAWGDVGMFVCADARMVEVPRTVAIRGARLLLDPTALVLSPVGTNAQLEFMLATRAWENGAYLAVANKCGVEAGIAEYAGRSAILDPSGARLAEAGDEDPEIITATIDLAGASGPPIPRVPDRYPELAMPVDELPIAQVLSSPPPATALRLAMLGPDAQDAERMLRELRGDVAVGPGASDLEGAIVPDGRGFRSDARDRRSEVIVEVSGIRVGLLWGQHGLVPEECRALMLRGAAVVLWNVGEMDVPEFVARTRAAENAIFLVLVSPSGGWRAYGPGGQPVGAAREGVPGALLDLPVALTWQKEMAPETDVVRGRRPEEYLDLVALPP